MIRVLDILHREGRTVMGHLGVLPGLARVDPGLVNHMLQAGDVGHDTSSRGGKQGEGQGIRVKEDNYNQLIYNIAYLMRKVKKISSLINLYLFKS